MASPEKSMPVTISSTEVQRQFGQVVRRTFSGKEHFIVERDGLPVVAIISMSEYEDFLRERELEQDRQTRLKGFRDAVEADSLTQDDIEPEEERFKPEIEARLERFQRGEYKSRPLKDALKDLGLDE